jgi:hypothetical protein
MHDVTVEALARLHQKLDGWIGQRAHDPGHGCCSPTRLIRPEEQRHRVSHGGRGKETP